jgi:hypothetical protein
LGERFMQQNAKAFVLFNQFVVLNFRHHRAPCTLHREPFFQF